MTDYKDMSTRKLRKILAQVDDALAARGRATSEDYKPKVLPVAPGSEEKRGLIPYWVGSTWFDGNRRAAIVGFSPGRDGQNLPKWQLEYVHNGRLEHYWRPRTWMDAYLTIAPSSDHG